ncbi:angiotensin-converting enzyme-like [Amblyomma americanum]
MRALLLRPYHAASDMQRIVRLCVLCATVVVLSPCETTKRSSSTGEETAAERYLLGELESVQSRMCGEIASALWNFSVDSSEPNAEILDDTLQRHSNNHLELRKSVARFNWTSYTNATLRRAFEKLSFLGKYALDEKSIAKYLYLETKLSNTLWNLTVCQYRGGREGSEADCHVKYPDLVWIFSLSENNGERLHYFKQWMSQTGRSREDFLELMKIVRLESRLNGFTNSADYIMFLYEWPTFREDTENVWNALLPLYRQMHGLVRTRLIRMYGSRRVSLTGPVDVHLLGAQGYLTSNEVGLPAAAAWNEKLPISSKVPNLTAVRMFKLAESFYVSLGLPRLPPEFWEKSRVELSPSEAGFLFEASAWDFCNGQDYRIKMRSEATVSGLRTAYHELAHVYYFMQYKYLPHVFRTGANPGFHEAVADALSWLGIRSQSLQERLGVELQGADAGMRNLLEFAFDHVGPTFHSIATSKWLWKVLDEPESDENVDSLYWKMRQVVLRPHKGMTSSLQLRSRDIYDSFFRLKYEGIRTPLDSGKRRFHPPADYDFLAHVNRIRSMFSFIAQMQIIKYLCAAANHTARLHECDIYGSKEAGRRLISILKLGSSVPFPDVVEMINEDRSKILDPSAVLDYFSPVLEWLKNNEPEGYVGWSSSS